MRLTFDVEAFLKEYWQQKPALLRHAIDGWESPLSADDLAGLSLEDDAVSRIVTCEEGKWSVARGPFDSEHFTHLPESHWTLLVQDVDKWLDEADALLRCFDFLPRWRVDDIMVSYAAPGGSVGPHVDHYDVFLLQATGRREWLIDTSDSPDLRYEEGQPLKLLASFEPTDSFILEPGDMLYLPPGVPHHGIGREDCTTWSVGMRAPSISELSMGMVDALTESIPEERRLEDAGRAATEQPGMIAQADLDRVRRSLAAVVNANDGDLARAFGRFITAYQLPEFASEPDGETLPAMVRPSPWSRWAYVPDKSGKAVVFANGEVFQCEQATAQALIDDMCLQTKAVSATDKQLVDQWWRAGLLEDAI